MRVYFIEVCTVIGASLSEPHTSDSFVGSGTADLSVKKGNNSGVIKGRFYMTTSLSDSWEAFTPLYAGVTLGRFLH